MTRVLVYLFILDIPVPILVHVLGFYKKEMGRGTHLFILVCMAQLRFKSRVEFVHIIYNIDSLILLIMVIRVF